MNSMPSMPMPAGSGLMPLDPSQFDLSNTTQAADFLSQLLDDSILQVDAQKYSRYFWYSVLAVIAVFVAHRLIYQAILILRIRRANANSSKPTSTIKFVSKIAKLCRVITYPQLTPIRARFWIQIPPFGTILLLFIYFGLLLALEFINNDVPGAQYWTSLAIRAGWLAVSQMPLLILLAGKNNLIGLLTGLSYGRLNTLHRWVSRAMLLMAILHFSLFNYSWNKYGIRSLEWSTDFCVPTGAAAAVLLVWMNISTLAPIRNILYEFFVVQHLLTFFGFVVAIMYHLPTTALATRTYIWIPIGLYLFDRLVRTGRSVWTNSTQVQGSIVSYEEDFTKIRVRGSRVRKWRPGSFVLLSIPSCGLVQSHPATIASTPNSHGGDLVFLLRAHRGFTKNLLSAASKADKVDEEPQQSHRAFIDGPYNSSQADFAAFDTVLLIAGSTGITFVLAILLDLSTRVSSQRLPLKRLQLAWAIKKQSHFTCVSEELEGALASLKASGIEVLFEVFITCDDRMTGSVQASSHHGCQCQVSTGQPCCCTELEGSQIHKSEGRVQSASMQSGRPRIDGLVSDLLQQAQGEMGVAVCGPLGMSSAVRWTVTRHISAKHAIYLHVEGFGW